LENRQASLQLLNFGRILLIVQRGENFNDSIIWAVVRALGRAFGCADLPQVSLRAGGATLTEHGVAVVANKANDENDGE
jgi:hypothetical protein